MRRVPGVAVAAVADVDAGRARAFARRHRIPAAYASAEALLAGTEVDAVAVLTPHDQHLAPAVAAARRGRHVLVEKPLAESVERADAIIAACRAAGVTLGGVFQNRFTPAARSLRRAVRAGTLGRVVLASVSVTVERRPGYFRAAPWRGRRAAAGGGVLMIQAIHMLDLLVWILGMPRRVLARTTTAVHAVEVDDLAVGLLELPGGAHAVLQATTAAAPEVPPELTVHGTRGTAAVFDSRGRVGYWRGGAGRRARLPERWAGYRRLYRPPARTGPTQASAVPHAAQIRDFVAAVRAGRPPLVDGGEARKALRLVEALYRSAAAGEWIALPGGGR